jgi:predicted MFS family arabinose efflux permease
VATVLNSVVLDRAGLDKLLRPRMDVVTEQVGDGGDPGTGPETGTVTARFEAAVGPLRTYERTVEARPRADGRFDVTERSHFELAIPLWGIVFVPGYRHELRRLDRRDSPRHPWWAPPDRVDARAARILGLLCTVSLVVGYLGTVVTQTITYATDGFGASDSAQGNLLAAVRVGVLLALVIVALADRRGRRRLVLGATIASCAFTALGALAPSMIVLGATQVVSRGLSMSVVMLITVIAAEEMPAGSRAYAVSVMTMTGALGAGMCLWALPLTGLGDNAWRLLYVIPLLGIPVTLWVARYLPESRRFARPHRDVAVLRGHGRRMALLGASFFLISSFGAPATQLMNDFLKDERGFSASRIALFTMLTTTPGGIGLVAGGRMADVRGKRLIVAVGVAGGAALTLASFMSEGWPMWVWNLFGTILAAAAGPALGMYGPELFPTSARGRANGIIQTVSVAGSALGLVFAGRMLDSGGLASAMRPLLIGPLIVAVLVLLFFPETARRELEELNPEDQGPGLPVSPDPATSPQPRR